MVRSLFPFKQLWQEAMRELDLLEFALIPGIKLTVLCAGVARRLSSYEDA